MRPRILLALLGFALLLLALLALAYVGWPLPVVREQFWPEPTLFAPPQSWRVGGGRWL